MRTPDQENVRELTAFKPALGVLSVFVDLDPVNRGDAWKIRLRDAIDEAVADRRNEPEVKATVERVHDHFRSHGNQRDTGRYVVGFLEVSVKGGRDEWFELQAPKIETAAQLNHSPFMPPLLKLLDQAPVAGVVALSTEKVELYEWRFGMAESVGSWEFQRGDTGRERKAPVVDPSHGTTTSSSGRDQFNQRLDENRHRFLIQAGEAVTEIARKRGWRKVICFGHDASHKYFVEHFGEAPPRLAGNLDLVGHPLGEIARAASNAIADWEAEREKSIIARATDAALSNNGRGAVGMTEVTGCLEAGRVDHLIYDSSREFDGELDTLVAKAIATGAHVTPVEADRADALAEHGGVAAILRY
ncbi:MAG: hypothetical protein HZB14_08230 [Actinobacteria bacterium]|nr:hypothetical protein [Actinomycetota bacterium]